MLKFIDKTDVFRALDAKLHEELKWSNPLIHLKTWQDMAVYELLRDHQNADIAEIGGGDSRILHKLAANNRCTNIDRFEGADGGPPKPITIPGVDNILAYVGQTQDIMHAESFDTLYSVSVVEHVMNDQAAVFFADMLRLLKPGGLCIHAIDLYIGSTPQPWSQARLDMYQGWIADPRVVPLGPAVARAAIFHSRMASNPDMTMWSWSKFAPQLRALREESQSVSLLLGFRKR